MTALRNLRNASLYSFSNIWLHKGLWDLALLWRVNTTHPFRKCHLTFTQHTGSHSAFLFCCAWLLRNDHCFDSTILFYFGLPVRPSQHLASDYDVLIVDCWGTIMPCLCSLHVAQKIVRIWHPRPATKWHASLAIHVRKLSAITCGRISHQAHSLAVVVPSAAGQSRRASGNYLLYPHRHIATFAKGAFFVGNEMLPAVTRFVFAQRVNRRAQRHWEGCVPHFVWQQIA